MHDVMTIKNNDTISDRNNLKCLDDKNLHNMMYR